MVLHSDCNVNSACVKQRVRKSVSQSNHFGWFLFSVSVFFHFTFPIVPSAPPQDVQGLALDHSSLEVRWQPPPAEAQNGVITGYRLIHARADSNLGVLSASRITVDASERAYVLADLDTWTQYKVWVVAFTSVGEGPHSDVIIVQTDEDGMYHNACYLQKTRVVTPPI